MPFGGLLTVGLIGLAGSVTSGILGSNAAESAASEQTQAEQQGLQFQEQVWNQEQQNAAPYLSAGTTSLAQLMAGLNNGTFGAGSIPNAPTFTGTFTPPTLEQAEQYPGYQFTEEQGMKGILEAAGAAGGAISGGTLKSADQFDQNLAQTTYGNVFNQALQTYQTGLQGYNAQLAAYQANLAKQAQEFGQAFSPAQLGATAVAGINNTGQSVATNVGNLMGSIGNAQAAGTVGSANALTSAINGGANDLLQSVLLGQLLNGSSSSSTSPITAADLWNNPQLYQSNIPTTTLPTAPYGVINPLSGLNAASGVGPG